MTIIKRTALAVPFFIAIAAISSSLWAAEDANSGKDRASISWAAAKARMEAAKVKREQSEKLKTTNSGKDNEVHEAFRKKTDLKDDYEFEY